MTRASRELFRYEWRVIIETKTKFVEAVSNIWSGSLLIRSIISCLFRTHQPTIHTHSLLLLSYDCVSFDKRGLTHGIDDIGTHLSMRCRHLIRKQFCLATILQLYCNGLRGCTCNMHGFFLFSTSLTPLKTFGQPPWLCLHVCHSYWKTRCSNKQYCIPKLLLSYYTILL